MNPVRELHQQAMSLAEEAFVARLQGDMSGAKRLFRQAFEMEAQAAALVADTDAELARSVLHRSAATLALDCDEIHEAERLIARALAGNPPPEIAEELRDLLGSARNGEAL